jgi:hypothetical protein
MLGYADYRMPVAGFYLNGSAADPRGGVTAASFGVAATALISRIGIGNS